MGFVDTVEHIRLLSYLGTYAQLEYTLGGPTTISMSSRDLKINSLLLVLTRLALTARIRYSKYFLGRL